MKKVESNKKRYLSIVNIPSVKNIVKIYKKGGINRLQNYLNDNKIKIEEETWAAKIKTLLNEDKKRSAAYEIELVALNINLENELNNEEYEEYEEHGDK